MIAGLVEGWSSSGGTLIIEFAIWLRSRAMKMALGIFANCSYVLVFFLKFFVLFFGERLVGAGAAAGCRAASWVGSLAAADTAAAAACMDCGLLVRAAVLGQSVSAGCL